MPAAAPPPPPSLAEVQALIAQAVSGGVTQSQVNSTVSSAISALTIPTPATAMPPGVSDSGARGTATDQFARSDHTHASKARKQIITMGAAASTYKWTYPTPFAAGVVPVVSGIVQVASGNQDLFNVQILGAPTNTDCTFQINRVSAGLLALVLGALSLNPNPVAATLHMIALEP